jgi:uroporphyrinogen-III decarboxylase
VRPELFREFMKPYYERIGTVCREQGVHFPTHAPGARSRAVLERHGVREEVRSLIDTFDRPDGGMCIAAGNGIVGGAPFENIAALWTSRSGMGQSTDSGLRNMSVACGIGVTMTLSVCAWLVNRALAR